MELLAYIVVMGREKNGKISLCHLDFIEGLPDCGDLMKAFALFMICIWKSKIWFLLLAEIRS